MELKTKRLLLRPWRESDAADLFAYAKDPRVGPPAAWPPHTSVAHSREVIQSVLSAPETYAVVPKTVNKPVGSVGLMLGKASNLDIGDAEAEIGYWIGVPFWGRGLIPEAVNALLHRAFTQLELTKVWCCYDVGNEPSRRVQEKCGFIYHHTDTAVACALTEDIRDQHVSCLTREQWEALRSRAGTDR